MIQETEKWLQSLGKGKMVEFNGKCHDCGTDVTLIGDKEDISGGYVWKFEGLDEPFFKCPECYGKDAQLRNFQPCEVWSRPCGYLRPTSYWNVGKKAEFKERRPFVVG